jgi:hypothetical protein
MRLTIGKIEKRLNKSTVEPNGWVSFEPMENGLGRLLTMDELRAMPLARLIALVRRVRDYILVGNDNDYGLPDRFNEETVFQICYINKKDGWGYSDLVHLRRACRGKGGYPSKSVRKLKRQCQAQFKQKDVNCVSSGNVTVNLENGSVFVNGMCQNPWPGLCEQHVKSITN